MQISSVSFAWRQPFATPHHGAAMRMLARMLLQTGMRFVPRDNSGFQLNREFNSTVLLK
jgi:hypothetical protein